MIFSYLQNMQSHPSWVCGLKQSERQNRHHWRAVTPFVGVWIETRYYNCTSFKRLVTPFVGVWIETYLAV